MSGKLSEQRSDRVVLRLSPEVLEQVDAAARTEGLTRSRLVEHLVLAGLGRMSPGQDRISGVQFQGARPRPDAGPEDPTPPMSVPRSRQPTTRPPGKTPPMSIVVPSSTSVSADDWEDLEELYRAACECWPGDGAAEAARDAACGALLAARRGEYRAARDLATLAQELERHHGSQHEVFDAFFQKMICCTAKGLLSEAVRGVE